MGGFRSFTCTFFFSKADEANSDNSCESLLFQHKKRTQAACGGMIQEKSSLRVHNVDGARGPAPVAFEERGSRRSQKLRASRAASIPCIFRCLSMTPRNYRQGAVHETGLPKGTINSYAYSSSYSRLYSYPYLYLYYVFSFYLYLYLLLYLHLHLHLYVC